MALEVRSVHAGEVEAFQEAMVQTFGTEIDVDPDFARRFEALLGPTRAWVVVDGPTIVATAGAFELDIAVPGGGALPIAGLTMVTVCPTHRRRGLAGKAIGVVQVALSMLLVVGAGLFVQTLIRLGRVPLGFRSHNLLLFSIQLPIFAKMSMLLWTNV
jgi:hypothetical protein